MRQAFFYSPTCLVGENYFHKENQMSQLYCLHEYCKKLQLKGFKLILVYHEFEHMIAQEMRGLSQTPILEKQEVRVKNSEVDIKNLIEEDYADLTKLFLLGKDPTNKKLFGNVISKKEIFSFWSILESLPNERKSSMKSFYNHIKKNEEVYKKLFSVL